MRRRLVLFGALALSSCASGSPPVGSTPETAASCATILATNDEHGHLLPGSPSWAGGRPVGGVAALGTYFAQARTASADCPVFLFSAGDLMQGTLISNLTDGESMIAAMNLLGYDAAAIGNHEFDWGVDVLQTRMRQAEFPFLGANIYEKGTDAHPEWVEPWAIVQRGNVRIGVIGAATETTPIVTRPQNVSSLDFRPIADALDRYIPRVRAEGVDFVVVLLHAGGFCEEDGSCDGEAIRELERTRERFDYAVTGHTHSRIETLIHGAPVVQSFSYTTAFSIGRLERQGDGSVRGRILDIRTAWADEVAPDAALRSLVERYRAETEERANRPVAVLAEPLEKGTGEYPLGRLIADAQRAATGTQVAIMNNGGIRTGLPAGPISYGRLFEVQPFQNVLVVLTVRGSVLRAALEHAVDEDGPDAQVSGIRVEYDPSAPAGARVRSVRFPDGSVLDDDSYYSLTVNDFMAAGGSGFSMLADAEESTFTGIVDLDALVAHLRGLPQPVRAPRDARWFRSDA